MDRDWASVVIGGILGLLFVGYLVRKFYVNEEGGIDFDWLWDSFWVWVLPVLVALFILILRGGIWLMGDVLFAITNAHRIP